MVTKEFLNIILERTGLKLGTSGIRRGRQNDSQG